MKISPLGQGVGAIAQNTNPTIDPAKVARAKAIAAGETPIEPQQSSGDPQVDRINTKRIKMKTQRSIYRELPPEVLETPTTEVTTQASPEEDKPDVIEPVAQGTEETRPLSPQFAALAKAKRALQVKERELVTREEALKLQSPAGNEDLIAKLKANPLSVLQEAGVTYDQLTEAIMQNQTGVSPELQAMKAELKALKEELNNQFSTRDKNAETQVLAELKSEAMDLTREGEQFEAIRAAEAQDDVVNLIHRVWQKGWTEKGYPIGHVMDVSEAAEIVENQLLDEALPFAKLKKVQSRLTPAQEAVVAAQIPQPKPGIKVMRTLTNRDSAMPVMDRKARAMAAFAGTLKKG
jgi:predicted mannosyl-3-phosphoglycerate phosphatase (HAD superfamily)